jgi:succinoglycan biosynthesis protein ExoA
MREWPGVSVIMPVRNEERHLSAAVGQVLAQDYAGDLEVIMAVGPSADRTSAIAAELAAGDDRVRVVLNPTGRTPSALNIGVAAARHDVVVRVDGHGELGAGYVRRAVELLAETGAANVGGVMDARGVTAFEQAVAHVYTSRLGLGGGAFHVGDVPAGPAETVFLGVFRREALLAVGGFDESMWRAQDWELNYRLRRSGRLVWFSPELRVTYRPRSRVRDLAQQMFDTGRWRHEVMRRHPDTANLRYLAPPGTVVALAAGTALGLVGSLTGVRWLRAGYLAPGGYASVVLLATAAAPPTLRAAARAWLPVVLGVTHLSWGAGFLVGSRPVDASIDNMS